MTDSDKKETSKLDNSKANVVPLGDAFEVIEEKPKKAKKPTPTGGGAPSPLRSVESWVSLGLALGLAGLLGGWATNGVPNLIHGGLLAALSWQLMRSGMATVQATHSKISPILPALLLGYAGLRFVFFMTGNDSMDSLLGWGLEGDATGSAIAMLGGLIAVAGPTLGKKADAKLPKAEPIAVDAQFSQTLLAYLLIIVGLLMPWAPGTPGVHFWLGSLTLIFVLMGAWASWVGMWKLWQMPIVTGKLGLVFFLAPIEAILVAAFGLIGQSAPAGDPDVPFAWAHEIWGGGSGILSWGGGPLLTLGGACFAFYLLFHGAKAAVALNKQRKEEEIASRKASRAAKKAAK
ncbi:MAG: hypothetical protein HOM34_02165 [Planctomycetes bacterium]|jgi:hypothetical protein|nr:hypothetical protein [Planctomycetota bacterium]MBT4028496.1 hypothetical protein [Planctomycetota bacterium]MBT4559388.1 hypothetical protein [Planctomycetota bacterium]MBT5119508.1 hypothetical protein [Planctomycetota bacterium]MBT7012384.1 hypothetical protein [Planctomycetota bacterium]